MVHKTWISALAFIGALSAGSAGAVYPDRPITFIIGSDAGSSSDIGTRTWQPFMEKCLGNGANLIIVAKPGAGTVIGIVELLKAKPDGYTLGQLTLPAYVTAPLAKPQPWKADSFTHIGSIVGTSSTVNVAKDGKLKSLKDVIGAAKTSTPRLGVGVGSVGGDDFLAVIQLMALAKIDVNIIPFGSSNQARSAVLGGNAQVVLMNNTETGRFLEQVTPVAIASAERDPLLPDVPTFREQGYDLVTGATHIVSSPAGMPAEVVTKWRDCLGKIAVDPDFLAEAKKRSVPVLYRNAEQTTAFINDQAAVLGKLWAADPWIK